jgi:lipopolysaccharide transport system ATP-binding protein
MADSIITVENLSKCYVIGHESHHDNLRDTLHHTARKLWRRLRWGTGFRTEEFWALRDVSFEVKQGDVLGIIGRNGAGKSTLLKILSRITEPTAGQVRMRGRVASLLEVGTGFHPELTGRDNIFLNGAILGMKRAEIRHKFDEIVAFAEVERFLDTPVKHYSSGMYVRLAFAVAAHLEPEILIVDEVLAVGDTTFQRKCLGKMRDVSAQDGRTVIFVSHNLAAVRQLCSCGLFLKDGRGITFAPIGTALAAYLNESQEHAGGEIGQERVRSEVFSALRVSLLDRSGETVTQVMSGDPVTFRIHYCQQGLATRETKLGIALQLVLDGQKVANFWNLAFPEQDIYPAPEGYWDCHIPRWPFRAGNFQVNLFIHRAEKALAWMEDCLVLQGLDGYFHGGTQNPLPDQGLIFVEHTWKTQAS